VGGRTPFVGGRGEHVQADRIRERKAHHLDLDPLCELGLCLHLPWCRANILVKEDRRDMGAGRSIGIRKSGGGGCWTGMMCVIFVMVVFVLV